MKLRHIDNSFYRLTAQQAKTLSVEHRLPRPGYQMRADLIGVELLTRCRLTGEWKRFVGPTPRRGWIQKTPLSWHDGETVPRGWTWSVMVEF